MWTTTLALTFLFFLIQLGTGFSILAIAPAKLFEALRWTKAQSIVLGITIGAPATSILLGLLSLWIDGIWTHFAIMVAISCFGLAWTCAIWRPLAGDIREAGTWCIAALPIALVIWWYSFGAFSSFPFMDLGADVHWMKTAQEYANSGVINPYAGQSYVDLRSALAGALSGTVGLDLLQFGWTYRYASIVYFLLATYSFAQGIYPDESRRRWVVFLFAATSVAPVMTNGSLAVASSVVFLGVLMSKTAGDALNLRPVLLLIAISSATLLAVFFINNNTLTLALLLVGLFVLRTLNSEGRISTTLFLGGAWPTTLLLAHRGSNLFVPSIIAAWLLYIVIVQAIYAWPARTPPILRLFSLALPLLIAGIAGVIAGMRFGYIPSTNADDVFSWVTTLILNKKIESGDELFLGAGPQVALIELGRAIGPVFPICVTLGVAWWWTARPVFGSATATTESRADRSALLVWSWIAGCGLSLVVLSGFPFLYRTTAIILSLLSITATEAFCQLAIDPALLHWRRRALIAAPVVILATSLVVALYGFAWRAGLRFTDYQAFLRPTEVCGVVLLIALVPFAFARARSVYIWGLAGILSLSIAIDRIGLSGITKTYSFGQLPDHTSVVSHYNASDLEAAFWIRDHLRKGVILSDPYTQGAIQALTGAPAAYLFSNLDTVNEALAKRLKGLISAIIQPEAGNNRLANTCGLVSALLRDINRETYFQMWRTDAIAGVLKPVRSEQVTAPSPAPLPAPAASEGDKAEEHQAFENVMTKGDARWDLVAIINPRTIEWTQLKPGQRLPYFPPTGTLDPGLAKMLNAASMPVLYSNSQTVVVRIPCSD
ncbi:hypothetical protein EAS56_18665 [Bradyrhizobium guangzhouense]|uniref:Glycosyltransferase RgtA/B/C/D-like domain-containing protein n=1 Tax=Bradyrhizobium guangzhouense TaxID=1325095 RepID=A0ABY0E7C1_9BRAD|nr:hypothetical protein [Bradyrhizobium guangzhouense]RXH12146.1 hypothetical protein EAS56_18665 [Bradyrhizobium guangzhouense]